MEKDVTYPFQKYPKSNHIIDNPVAQRTIKPRAQYGADLSCLFFIEDVMFRFFFKISKQILKILTINSNMVILLLIHND